MSRLTLAQKRALIAKHITTAKGRQLLAASMNRPLREYRDYTSAGRRGLSVDPLADGQLPYYDKDVNCKAYVVGELGEDILSIEKGDRVFVPTFEIATLVEIPMSQIKERRYDIQERVKTKTRSEVIRVEDRKIFGLISKVANATGGNAPIAKAAANLTVGDISDAMGLVEQHGDIKAATIFINPKHHSVLRKMNSVKDGFFISFEDSKALMQNGTVGTLYGATIIASSEVPANEIFVLGEPELTGALVESIPLTVLSGDKLETRALLFSVFEKVGIVIHNPNAVASIKLS